MCSVNLWILLVAILSFQLLAPFVALLASRLTILKLFLVLADLLFTLLRQDGILELATQAGVFPLEELLVS